MSSMATLSTGGGIPIRQTKLAPDGLAFSEDVSGAGWVEESLSNFGTVRALLPGGFPAYARLFHPAYLDGDDEQPVRWSTVASWTGRTVHPLMQFQRVAGLSEDPGVMYKDPSWGSHPQIGSIPERECRTLVRGAQGLHLNPRQLLLLPLGRVWQHRHPPIQRPAPVSEDRGGITCCSGAPSMR